VISNKGMTLIEVLIALAILSIALTAIIKSSSQNIKHTQHIEHKISASLVAKNVMNEILTGLKEIPNGETLMGTSSILNNKWSYKANIENTKNPEIKEIKIKIFKENSEDEFYQLESYLYVSAS